jgi:hypothetical protein
MEVRCRNVQFCRATTITTALAGGKSGSKGMPDASAPVVSTGSALQLVRFQWIG